MHHIVDIIIIKIIIFIVLQKWFSYVHTVLNFIVIYRGANILFIHVYTVAITHNLGRKIHWIKIYGLLVIFHLPKLFSQVNSKLSPSMFSARQYNLLLRTLDHKVMD